VDRVRVRKATSAGSPPKRHELSATSSAQVGQLLNANRPKKFSKTTILVCDGVKQVQWLRKLRLRACSCTARAGLATNGAFGTEAKVCITDSRQLAIVEARLIRRVTAKLCEPCSSWRFDHKVRHTQKGTGFRDFS
jgi:hypothetical protein